MYFESDSKRKNICNHRNNSAQNQNYKGLSSQRRILYNLIFLFVNLNNRLHFWATVMGFTANVVLYVTALALL